MWGSPTPSFTDLGMVYQEGFWTPSNYPLLIIWIGNCRTALTQSILLSDKNLYDAAVSEVHIKDLTEQAFKDAKPLSYDAVLDRVAGLVDSRTKARDELVKIARRQNVVAALSQVINWAALVTWATQRPHLLLQLSVAGFLPKRPQSIIPPTDKRQQGEGRQRRMSAMATEVENVM